MSKSEPAGPLAKQKGIDSIAQPPSKKRDIDPIAPTNRPWDLPAKVCLLHCGGDPGGGVLEIPREANLPIDDAARRVVAQISQAVVAVACLDARGTPLRRASGFIIEFDDSNMTGTILSAATATNIDPIFPDIKEIRVYLYDGASYRATVRACDDHWNLLVLSVSFDRAVRTMGMVKIRENRNHLSQIMMPPHSDREMLSPGDSIIGLGRESEEPFGLQVNCGVYRKFCRPAIGVFGVNLHNAQSSLWVENASSLHDDGMEGFLVELVSQSVASAGLQEKDLIIQCNAERVATSLELFEILAEKIGKSVDLTFIKADDNKKHSISIHVKEITERNFYRWPKEQHCLTDDWW